MKIGKRKESAVTCVSSALETGEGSGDAGTLLTARAQSFHGVFHLGTGHLQQSIQGQFHRDCLEDRIQR